MTNAELQIAIDAIRNATTDGSVTNVMEADIFEALKSNNIPLTGTTEGNPVTGSINFGQYSGSKLISSSEDGTNEIDLTANDGGVYITHKDYSGNISGQLIVNDNGIEVKSGAVGCCSGTDYSEIEPTNKLIYAQRSYVEKPETLITALNNCDSTQLDEIKTILGII